MSEKIVYRAPKRRIERIVSRINQGLSTSQQDYILHAAEDSKTLIRARLVFELYVTAGTGMHTTAHMLQVAPKSTVLQSLTMGNSLDQDVPTEEILQEVANVKGGVIDTRRVVVDTKAMRKLKPGDEIVYSNLADVANCAVNLTCYLWFKE